MKGFRFRMDPILELRAAQLEASRAELERERQQCDEHEKAADDAQERDLAAAQALEASTLAGTIADRLRSSADAQETLRAESRRAALNAARSARNVTEARERLVEAFRRARSLEVLRERSLNRWKRDRDRRDQQATDEVAARGRKR